MSWDEVLTNIAQSAVKVSQIIYILKKNII